MIRPPTAMKLPFSVFAILLVTAVTALTPGYRFGLDATQAPSKILLVSIDTTRADHLSAYGYRRPTSPFLKRLANNGVRVANAYAVMPTTDPSHASILTGQYPRTHGIMRNAARRLDPKAPTLGTWLTERGYQTAAITARVGLDPKLRLIAGFDHTDAPRAPQKWRTADEIVERASQWLAERDGRWFLWVHLWEPHLPYDPPEPYRERFAKKPVRNLKLYSEPERFLEGDRMLSSQKIERAKWLYDGEIAAADTALQRIVNSAYEAGPDTSSPLVMVVSDHGESMAERQKTRRIGFGHGVLLYDETVKVPWITTWDGKLDRHVIETPVSLVDLAPTLMELVDPAGRAFETEGRSIAAALRGGAQPEHRVFYLERRLFNSDIRADLKHPETAVIDYPWKLIANEAVGDPELYRLDRDPLEEHNVFSTATVDARRLAERLTAWREANPLPEQRGPASRTEEQEELDELDEHDRNERDALRALGYID